MTTDQLAFGDDSLARERERIERERWTNEGCRCGACSRLAKVYRRPMYASEAIALIHLVKLTDPDGEWINRYELPLLQGVKGGGDLGKLVHWGLVEPKPRDQNPKKRSSGYWRPTRRGVAFARGQSYEPRAVYLYHNELVPPPKAEPPITIRDVLPDGFDYEAIWLTEAG